MALVVVEGVEVGGWVVVKGEVGRAVVVEERAAEAVAAAAEATSSSGRPKSSSAEDPPVRAGRPSSSSSAESPSCPAVGFGRERIAGVPITGATPKPWVMLDRGPAAFG